MLKAQNFTKKKPATDTLIKFAEDFPKNILENGTGWILSIVLSMVGLWLKLQMEMVN